MTHPRLNDVQNACAELTETGDPITFDAVAQRVGVSRATLYRNRDLRETIERYRDPTGQQLTVTRLASQVDQLRDSLEAVAELVRRHEQRLRRLDKKISSD